MALKSDGSISIVFPAYDEEDNIHEAVQQAMTCAGSLFQDWEVIVVNDGSRDRTGEIVRRMEEENDRVIAVHHPTNGGYGAALRSGFQAATKELVFFCDSDLQFHLSELVLLLTWIEQYDYVIGYRMNRQDPIHRRLNAWGWNQMVRTVLGLKVRDIDCAFKVFRRSMFDHIKIEAVGAMVNTEILVQAKRMGFRCREIPVTHFPRQAGEQSGANIRVVIKAFKELLQLHRKLAGTSRIVSGFDRRSKTVPVARERHVAQRRRVDLCINFPDRRRRQWALEPAGEPSLKPTFEPTPPGLMPESATATPQSRPATVFRSTDAPTVESDHVGSRRLRVAMVAAGPFPANHGTPGSIREMAAAVAAAGHDVHVVTYPFGDGTALDDLTVHRTIDLGFNRKIVVGPTWQKPLLDFLMIFTLRRVIRRERIDVVHAHNYEGALVGFFGKLFTGRPLIYNAINTMSDELPSYGFIRPRALAVGLARALDYIVPRLADRIMAISPELTTFLSKQRIPDERVEMIPLGVDLTAFDVTPDPSILDHYSIPGGRLVLYTGILDTFQRVDYLVQAMAVVAEACPDSRLVLATNVARDEDIEACHRQIRNLGLERRVNLLLDVPFEAIPHLLAAADVAVVSRPNCPGLPIKLLNYMAAARPIVACEGSAKGLTDMRNAIVTPDHDWDAMGRGIVRLLQDPDLAARLGREARRHALEHFSWPVLTPRMETVYNDALTPRARRVAATGVR